MTRRATRLPPASRWPMLFLFAAWPSGCLLFAFGAAADEPPGLILTTDTPQYCAQLGREVAARHSQVAEVQRLVAEGREMCDRGQIHGGILRIRRAFIMLRHTPRS